MKKFNEENTVHFITINTFKKFPLFESDDLCRIIIDNLNFYRQKFLFNLSGYVIMPDHIHLLIQLDEKYNDISKAMQGFKSHVARKIIDYLKNINPDALSFFRVAPEPLLGRAIGRSRGSDLPSKGARLTKRERKIPTFQIWQKDFYDFNIYSEKKLEQKLDYIHQNPVKADLVKNPEDWKWSSYRNYYLNDETAIKIDKILP